MKKKLGGNQIDGGARAKARDALNLAKNLHKRLCQAERTIEKLEEKISAMHTLYSDAIRDVARAARAGNIFGQGAHAVLQYEHGHTFQTIDKCRAQYLKDIKICGWWVDPKAESPEPVFVQLGQQPPAGAVRLESYTEDCKLCKGRAVVETDGEAGRSVCGICSRPIGETISATGPAVVDPKIEAVAKEQDAKDPQEPPRA